MEPERQDEAIANAEKVGDSSSDPALPLPQQVKSVCQSSSHPLFQNLSVFGMIIPTKHLSNGISSADTGELGPKLYTGRPNLIEQHPVADGFFRNPKEG